MQGPKKRKNPRPEKGGRNKKGTAAPKTKIGEYPKKIQKGRR